MGMIRSSYGYLTGNRKVSDDEKRLRDLYRNRLKRNWELKLANELSPFLLILTPEKMGN